jgi:hypothetical protein
MSAKARPRVILATAVRMLVAAVEEPRCAILLLTRETRWIGAR